MQLPESTIDAIRTALDPVIRLIGQRSADTAAAVLASYGVPVEDLELADIMAIGATARIGSLAAMGFFEYVPLENGFSRAAEQAAQAYRDPAIIARLKKVGVIYTALVIDMHNFTPLYQMLASAVAANGGETAFPLVTELLPCSDGAVRWARELGSPLRYQSHAPSVPDEDLKQLTSKITLETIREKALISEKEMALLISISPKSLGNRRRAHEVNRGVFVQKDSCAKVRYNKTKALAALQNSTFFVSSKPGRKNRGHH